MDDDDNEKKKEEEKKESEEEEKDEDSEVDIDDPDKPDADLPSNEDSHEGQRYTDKDGTEYVYLNGSWIKAEVKQGNINTVNGKDYIYYNGRWIPCFYSVYTLKDNVTGIAIGFVSGGVITWLDGGKLLMSTPQGAVAGAIIMGSLDFHLNLKNYNKQYFSENELKERSQKAKELTEKFRKEAGGLDE